VKLELECVGGGPWDGQTLPMTYREWRVPIRERVRIRPADPVLDELEMLHGPSIRYGVYRLGRTSELQILGSNITLVETDAYVWEGEP
jgi:hypothetical protein